MFLLLLAGCLFDRATYERRLNELTDHDGVDQDCDGEIDEEDADGTTGYGDADGDGHGLASVVTTACSQPRSSTPRFS